MDDRAPNPTPEDLLRHDPAPPLRLKLRCGGCGRTSKREFDWACVSPEHAADGEEWDGVVLSEPVECHRCGAVDDYTIAPRSMLRLSTAASKRNRRANVLVGLSQLWDGTIVRRPSEALARLRELTREHPHSATAFRALGNGCLRWNRNEDAVPAWKRACELDEEEVEAAYALARHLLGAGERPEEGFGYLRLALERFPRAHRAGKVRPEMGRAVIVLLEGVVDRSRDPIALMAAWSDGEIRGDPVLNMSSVDLRKVKDFGRLADLVEAGHFQGLEVTPELPDEGPTNLERLLAGARTRPGGETVVPIGDGPPNRKPARASVRVGRNDPCPCGSGNKYKRCCGRKA